MPISKVKIDIGTHIEVDGKEFVVYHFPTGTDKGGMSCQINALDPILSMTRQMEQEKTRENQEKALKALDRVVEEMGKGEEWKKEPQ